MWSKIGPKAEGTTQNGSKARKDSKARKKVYSRKAEIMSSKRDDSDQKGLGMSGVGEA